MVKFSKLVGSEFLYYGTDKYGFKLDDTVWEWYDDEDLSSGESWLDEIIPSNNERVFSFPAEPIDTVKVTKKVSNTEDVFVLSSVNNPDREYLRIGTSFKGDFEDFILDIHAMSKR